MKRIVVSLLGVGVLTGMCAVWAWQTFGPRRIPTAWEGVDE